MTTMVIDDMVRARKRADISQDELAEEMGISGRSLWGFEAGRNELPRARSIADYYAGIEAIKARRAAQKQAQP